MITCPPYTISSVTSASRTSERSSTGTGLSTSDYTILLHVHSRRLHRARTSYSWHGSSLIHQSATQSAAIVTKSTVLTLRPRQINSATGAREYRCAAATVAGTILVENRVAKKLHIVQSVTHAKVGHRTCTFACKGGSSRCRPMTAKLGQPELQN